MSAIKIIIGIAVLVAFAILWRKGYFLRVTNYVQETRDELKKCSWPSRDELKGSTVVIMVSIVLLGVFTIVVDYAFLQLVHKALLNMFT